MALKLPVRIGTRGSPLALAQARGVEARLAAAHSPLLDVGSTAIEAIVTTGDTVQDRTLVDIGGKGLFTKEIDAALLDGRIALAVHSLKDLPTVLPEGIVLACVSEREDPRDALIGAPSIAALPQGAVVGTASLRRAAQLLHRRPDLNVVPLRGNVGTRIAKLDRGEVQATVLALAGLRRLRRTERAVPIAPEEILPAVGQGALAITCRSEDADTRTLLALIDNADAHTAILAERAFLATLDGSCRTPIAALAEIVGDGLVLRGLVATPDGRELLETRREGHRSDAEALGRDAGTELLRRCGPAFFALKA
jgi:hydroxymethylbilane synthase